jgi:Domain of unknown function (DUF5658)
MDSEDDQPSRQGGDLHPVRVRTKIASRLHALARAHWYLWILFIQLQISDIITTNRALAIPGNWEANPVMKLSQTHLGAAWWLPKVAVIGFAAVAVPKSLRPWPMFIAVWYYVMVVANNLASL